jgi:hypothetical protein
MFGQYLFDKQSEEVANRILLGDNKPNCTFERYSVPLTHANVNWINKGELIAGSALINTINNSVPNSDVDIYFHSKADAELFLSRNRTHGKIITAEMMCFYAQIANTKVNLIWGINYTSPEDLISAFDIRACAQAYDPANQEVIVVEGAYEDSITKTITMLTSARAATVKRIIKYTQKGFAMDKFQRVIFAELLKGGFHTNELEIITGYGE